MAHIERATGLRKKLTRALTKTAASDGDDFDLTPGNECVEMFFSAPRDNVGTVWLGTYENTGPEGIPIYPGETLIIDMTNDGNLRGNLGAAFGTLIFEKTGDVINECQIELLGYDD